MNREPDFEELVDEDDLSAADRERLRRVHDLLIAAGPPPDFEPATPPAPPVASITRLVPRRRLALVALAAAFLVAAFGAGYFTANHGGPGTERVVAMAGTAQAAGASASLQVFSRDSAGNWPMKLEVKGLTPREGSHTYQLWLTKNGRLAAYCGSFLAQPDGTAEVRLNAPFELGEYDSWVVVAKGSKTPLLTTA